MRFLDDWNALTADRIDIRARSLAWLTVFFLYSESQDPDSTIVCTCVFSLLFGEMKFLSTRARIRVDPTAIFRVRVLVPLSRAVDHHVVHQERRASGTRTNDESATGRSSPCDVDFPLLRASTPVLVVVVVVAVYLLQLAAEYTKDIPLRRQRTHRAHGNVREVRVA